MDVICNMSKGRQSLICTYKKGHQHNPKTCDPVDRAIEIIVSYSKDARSCCPASYDFGYNCGLIMSSCDKKAADTLECWHKYVRINPFKIDTKEEL
jgi:hypothetical protein